MYFVYSKTDELFISEDLTIVNVAVNLELCQNLEKSTYIHSTNIQFPSLIFNGCNATWVFRTVEERDKELDHMLRRH